MLATLTPGRSALLSMDCQAGIVSFYVKDPEFVPRVARVQKAARAAGLHMIHVQMGFRPNVPEVDPRNKLLGPIKASPQYQAFFQGAMGAFHADLAPEGADIVVTKHRISAFTGTDLSMILRANGIETVVLLGLVTAGVVLATLLDASDADYTVVVVKDCCLDQDAEVHRVLTEKFFPRLATVVSASEFLGE